MVQESVDGDDMSAMSDCISAMTQAHYELFDAQAFSPDNNELENDDLEPNLEFIPDSMTRLHFDVKPASTDSELDTYQGLGLSNSASETLAAYPSPQILPLPAQAEAL